jgi:hypothetical protein
MHFSGNALYLGPKGACRSLCAAFVSVLFFKVIFLLFVSPRAS